MGVLALKFLKLASLLCLKVSGDQPVPVLQLSLLWITLCAIGVKGVLMSGIKNEFIFIEKSPCEKDLAPYNALPLTRQTALLTK